jgi:YHS domain-containing protein
MAYPCAKRKHKDMNCLAELLISATPVVILRVQGVGATIARVAMTRYCLSLVAVAGGLLSSAADTPAPKSMREGLQPFQGLIGSWRCTGTPSGSREEQQKNFWTETMSVEWQFKGPDAWLKLDFKQDKDAKVRSPFAQGELRYRPKTDDYELKFLSPKKEALVFAGSLKERHLQVERQEGDTVHRVKLSLWHANRIVYSYSTRQVNKSLIVPQWSVGATKEGEAFAVGEGGPECIVSGGRGTMAVSYLGKTYYVCCSGCRSEFNESPAKYVAEYEAKKAKPAK